MQEHNLNPDCWRCNVCFWSCAASQIFEIFHFNPIWDQKCELEVASWWSLRRRKGKDLNQLRISGIKPSSLLMTSVWLRENTPPEGWIFDDKPADGVQAFNELIRLIWSVRWASVTQLCSFQQIQSNWTRQFCLVSHHGGHWIFTSHL